MMWTECRRLGTLTKQVSMGGKGEESTLCDVDSHHSITLDKFAPLLDRQYLKFPLHQPNNQLLGDLICPTVSL